MRKSKLVHVNISKGIKRAYKNNPEKWSSGEKHSKAVGLSTKGKFNKNPLNLFDLSTRTVRKIFKRMKLPCSKCGWNEGVCDIHHIRGRKIEDFNNHKNLTYVCPNCHRLIHENKIKVEELINIENYVGNKWLEFYFG